MKTNLHVAPLYYRFCRIWIYNPGDVTNTTGLDLFVTTQNFAPHNDKNEKIMTSLIQLTLDGSLVTAQNEVSLRVLGRSMISIQAAADRAYLDVKYGTVWKHARLPIKFYDQADFIVGDAEPGSYIIKFTSECGASIVKRIKEAIADPYRSAIEGGEQEVSSISRQIEAKKAQVENKILVPQRFEDFVRVPDRLATRTFGDKSINKNIDQMLTPVRKDNEAVIKLALKPSYKEKSEIFTFTTATAKSFSKVVGQRTLGNPVVYRGRMRMIDRGHNQKFNFKGKFTNSKNDKDLILNIHDEADYSALVPYMDKDSVVIVACPVIEYDSYDPNGGDIQFVKILSNG